MGDGAKYRSPALASSVRLLPGSVVEKKATLAVFPQATAHAFPVPRRGPPIVRTDEETVLPGPAPTPRFPVGLGNQVNGTVVPTAVSVASLSAPVLGSLDILAPRPQSELMKSEDAAGNTVYYQYNPQTDMVTNFGVDRPSLRHQPPANYMRVLNGSDYYLPPAFNSHPADGLRGVEVRGMPYFPPKNRLPVI